MENSDCLKSANLRKRLIAEGLKEARCEICKLDEWLGRPIPLQLDHINGDRTDNRLENLRLLCPNCHAQTDTYCGKNIGRAASTMSYDVAALRWRNMADSRLSNSLARKGVRVQIPPGAPTHVGSSAPPTQPPLFDL